MLLAPAPLAATTEKLRQNQRVLYSYIHETCDRIDRFEPEIHALLPEPDRRSRLLQEAKELAHRFPDPGKRPSLYGILVGVKDIFRVDGFPTRAGSQLPAEEFAGPEATCVTRLKQAGALVLGKTVTTEFAYFEPGPTRNPHNTRHTPGGSSSGSAAAVAGGLCQLALGTQTIGSIIRPAAFCGILGFKPSFGRIPTDGLIVFSHSADHVGFFTQDIAGLRLAAAILCDRWEPPTTSAATQDTLPVLGIPVGAYLQQTSPEGLAAFEAHVARLEQDGYRVKRIPAFDDIAAINQRHRRLTAAEAAHEHVEWFATYQNVYRPKTEEIILSGQTIPADEITACRAGQHHLRQHLTELRQEHALDAWICPSAPGDAPSGLESTGNPDMNLPWTHAGLPAVTVPSGTSQHGLPFGLQIVGDFMRDEDLLNIAQRIISA